ncbi:MAG: DinB family protein [Gemmatimonadetes bacterium]|nr:DinB family protein [Gemmatimonadota bacterium]
MEPWVVEGRSILASTPQVVRGWVALLSPQLLDAREAAATFSPREVVAHLVQAERDLWVPRLRSILEHGEERTFPSFDRFAHREWFEQRAVEAVLNELVELRALSLEVWDPVLVEPHRLEQRGRHPEFGPVTAAQLFATWVVHDMTHLRQIARVLARRFADAVGPWRAYLTVLRETGSAPAAAASE